MTDNSRTTAKTKKKKPRGKGKPFVKGDPRINRKGAPPRGASMKEVYAFYDDLTPQEIAELLPPGTLRNKYLRKPKELAVKHIRAIVAFAYLMEKPDPRILAYVDDRIDGKIKDEIEVHSTLEVENLQAYLKDVYGNKEEEADSEDTGE